MSTFYIAPVLVLATSRCGFLALLVLEVRDNPKAGEIGDAHHDEEGCPISAHGFLLLFFEIRKGPHDKRLEIDESNSGKCEFGSGDRIHL